MISIQEYQAFTPTTFVVDPSCAEEYLVHGLAGEVGELLSAYAKWYRGDYNMAELNKRVRGELGDIMYFLAQYANVLGLDLAEVMQENKDKLESRMRRNKIKGDGDDR